MGDHPRRCGENVRGQHPELALLGSPPQVRGKRSCKVFQQSDTGITPAGAGKTISLARKLRAKVDHPRRCGENLRVSRFCFIATGSPPQVRGKPLTDGSDEYARRITPAGAGKTRLRERHCNPPRDHPRRCGENRTDRKNAAEHLGSPPQVRGKRFAAMPSTGTARITPAGAGKTYL